MAAISTIIAGAALGLGAASAVSQNVSARKQRKSQKKANERQETQAREAAGLSQTQDNTGADVVFGTSKASDDLLKRGSRTRRKSGTKTAADAVGGL